MSDLPEPSPVEHGGRVELRLVPEGAQSEQVFYNARWFTKDQELEGRVTVVLGEKVQVNLEAPDSLPAWLATFTRSLVSTTARKATKEELWPRRLTRWRAKPQTR